MKLSNRFFAKRQRPIRHRVGALLLVGLFLVLGMALAPSAALAGEGGPTVEWRFSFPGSDGNSPIPAPFPLPLPQDATVFTDDLKVSGGESYDGDVVVYNGNVDIEGGGRIAGSLYVYSGNVDLKGGGRVSGDVIAYGGDVDIHGSGQVGGNVQALGGDVTLDDGASVGGDVSVFGGDIDRAAGAQVGGNVLSGPNITIPEFPIFPGAPEITIPGVPPTTPELPDLTNGSAAGTGFGNWLLRFVLNLFRAALFTLLAVIGAGLIVVSRPAIVDKSLAFVDDDPRTSFGVGLLANVVVMIPLWMWLGSLSAGFWAALCLSPLLLPLGLVALVIELTGLAVGGRWLGDRIADTVHFEWEPLAATAVGVTLVIGLTGFLWALTSCLGWLALVVLGAPGVGSLVIQWRERRSGGSSNSREIVASPVQPVDVPDVPQPDEPVAMDPDSIEAILDGVDDTQPSDDSEVDEFDFTQISGIGPVFAMRLRAANVRTLADLAAMTPESVADVLNVSVERVVRDDLLGQARRLLGLE